jgi:peptide chain release factor subunit 1
MLNREDIKDMAGAGGEEAYFASLYLNVNPAENPRGDYLIWYRNQVKRTAEALDGAVFRHVEGDLTEMEAYLQGNKRSFKKGLAIISSTGKSFLRTFNLSVPLMNELVVDTSPYIRPLLEVLERFRHYAVLLVDKEAARIFVVHLGEIMEYGEVHTADVPGRHKKGGWFALAQNHYDRHIEHHVALHLKDVAGRFEAFLKGEEIDRLVMGGSEEAILKMRKLLPPPVSEKIIGTFGAGMFQNNGEILKKVEPALEAYETRTAEETVARLLRRAMKGERAEVGLEGVLKALREGRVRRLVLQRDFVARGSKCDVCGALVVTGVAQCPHCEGALREVSHVADLAVRKAVEDGAEVEMVSAAGEFRDAGGIGAFLRF